MPNDRCVKARASFSAQRTLSTTLKSADTSTTQIADSSARIDEAPLDRLLTIPEFCKRYKRSRSRAYELIRSSALFAVKDGRSTLIPVDAAEAWVRQLPKA
jgi:Helix-turn-helix domain